MLDVLVRKVVDEEPTVEEVLDGTLLDELEAACDVLEEVLDRKLLDELEAAYDVLEEDLFDDIELELLAIEGEGIGIPGTFGTEFGPLVICRIFDV